MGLIAGRVLEENAVVHWAQNPFDSACRRHRWWAGRRGGRHTCITNMKGAVLLVTHGSTWPMFHTCGARRRFL